MAKKKWTGGDIVTLVLQVLAPVAAIVFTCLLPKGQALSADIKLAIIGAGIAIPIIIMQFSIIVGQNKSESDITGLSVNVNDISDKINHISPILEQVFLAGNDRAKRFVYRRMEEVTKTIRIALSNNNSGNLRPSEYYKELLYLANLIIRDHAEQKNNFKGEIWAMTSFADEEWIEDEGYEKLWTEKLSDMVDTGIKTRRLCVVPDSIIKLISCDIFSEEEANKIRSFHGFFTYLKTYYGNQSRKKIAEHYFIKSNDNRELTQIKGFFAIKLTSGELHILHGETVNEDGALTAKVLFDPSEIRRVHELFELQARPSQELGIAITNLSKKNGFIKYLNDHGVNF
jgi:hypothetical protein